MKRQSLSAEHLCSSIKQYSRETTGAAWEIFWDYKCSKSKSGEDIFESRNIEKTSMHLFIYLCCFGMARNTTNLAYSNLHVFSKMIDEVKTELGSLSDISFENLCERDRQPINKCCKAISHALEVHKISNSETMISKILMASWGQTPAFDTRFVKTYRKYLPPKPGDYFDALMKLSKEYNEKWEMGMNRLESRYAKTEGGNLIPSARLIDMGFWNIGGPL